MREELCPIIGLFLLLGSRRWEINPSFTAVAPLRTVETRHTTPLYRPYSYEADYAHSIRVRPIHWSRCWKLLLQLALDRERGIEDAALDLCRHRLRLDGDADLAPLPEAGRDLPQHVCEALVDDGHRQQRRPRSVDWRQLLDSLHHLHSNPSGARWIDSTTELPPRLDDGLGDGKFRVRLEQLANKISAFASCPTILILAQVCSSREGWT